MRDDIREHEIIEKLDAKYPGLKQIYDSYSEKEASGVPVDDAEFKKEIVSLLCRQTNTGNRSLYMDKGLGKVYAEAVERLSGGKLNTKMVAETCFTNRWDMIYATTIGPLNKAFQIFFGKGNRVVTISRAEGGEIQADIDSLAITDLNGTVCKLNCIIGKCSLIDIPYDGDKVSCDITNIDADITIELTSTVIGTKDNGDQMDVYLDLTDSKNVDNVTINKMDKPDKIGDKLWNYLIYCINEKIVDILAGALNNPYKVFSVSISEDTQATYDWVIPDVAKFSGAECGNGTLEDGFMAIYTLTLTDKNDLEKTDEKLKKLSLSIDSGIIPEGDIFSVGISRPIFMRYLLLPMLYEALEPSLDGTDDEKKPDYLVCKDEMDDGGLFIKDSWIESCRDYKIKVEDYNDITLKNTKVTMTDGGFHFESDFSTEQYWIDFDGSIDFDIALVKETDKDGKVTLVAQSSKPNIDISSGPSWKLWLVLAAVALIPVIGMIISGITLVITSMLDKIIDFDLDSFSFEIKPPVKYTNIELEEPADIAVSDGVLVSFDVSAEDESGE